jgi:hypothetical protein
LAKEADTVTYAERFGQVLEPAYILVFFRTLGTADDPEHPFGISGHKS